MMVKNEKYYSTTTVYIAITCQQELIFINDYLSLTNSLQELVTVDCNIVREQIFTTQTTICNQNESYFANHRQVKSTMGEGLQVSSTITCIKQWLTCYRVLTL